MKYSVFDIILAFALGIIPAVLIMLSLQKRMKAKLCRDYLTGLPGYRALVSFLKSIKNENYVFVLLDINDFRRFNRESYEAGDKVIRQFAAMLIDNFDGKARIFRYKLGDEFLLIFKKEDSSQILPKITRLSQDNSVTFSYSAREFVPGIDNAFGVLREAGEALCRVKANDLKIL